MIAARPMGSLAVSYRKRVTSNLLRSPGASLLDQKIVSPPRPAMDRLISGM